MIQTCLIDFNVIFLSIIGHNFAWSKKKNTLDHSTSLYIIKFVGMLKKDVLTITLLVHTPEIVRKESCNYFE